MIRPSPNELERLRNEEIAKRRLMRLKEVREYSKTNASKLRTLYKEHKLQIISKLAQTIQDQFNLEDSKKLNEMKLKHSCQLNAVGNGHDNAADWVDPAIRTNEQLEINLAFADKRHQMALKDLQEKKKERESIETARLKTMQLAMLIEKERAAEIANLPLPDIPLYLKESVVNSEDMTPRVKVCDRNKFSVIESFENASYNVQRMNSDDQIFNYNADNAKSAAEFRQNEMIKLSTDLHVQAEEQFIKAHLRGHKAIKKQLVHKDYQELVSDLEHVAKGEMAKRQREYHKNELIGPNSAGHFGVGHTAAMIMFKEKCRERAVEAAVMESLKDITNCAKQNNINESDAKSFPNEITIDNSNPEPQHKLSRLYEKIRKQKENVHFQDEISYLSSAVVNEVDEGSVKNNKQKFDSSQNFHEIQSNDLNCDLDAEESDNIIQHALSATGRSNIVLEKSTRQKERLNLEEDFLHIDKRFDQLSTKFYERQDATSVRSESTVEFNSKTQCHNSVGLEESNSNSIASRSVETQESDSVTKIRDFQRRAVMKLNGQLNVNEIATIEKQITNFSFDSSSVTGSLSNSLKSYNKTSNSESKHSKSIVNEWVNSQLIQTVDKIPEWVTRSTPKFIPDVNVSFRRSIVSIRSTDSSLRSVSSNFSSTTVASPNSSFNSNIQPSLTEITNEQHEYISEQMSSNNIAPKNLFNPPKEILTSFQSEILTNDSNDTLRENFIPENSLPISSNENSRDLIDFQSMDCLSVIQDSESNIMDIHYEPFISEINTKTNNFDDLSDSNENEKTTIINVSNSSQTAASDHYYSPTISNINLSGIVPSVPIAPSQYENAGNDNAEILINEYEQFLNNITQKINSSISRTEIRNNALNKSPNEFEPIDLFFSKDKPDPNSLKEGKLRKSELSNVYSDTDNSAIKESVSLQHDNEMDNSNNNKILSHSELSENTSLNIDINDLMFEKDKSKEIENEINVNQINESSYNSQRDQNDQLLSSICSNHDMISIGIDQSHIPLESIDTINDNNLLITPCPNERNLISCNTDQLISLSSLDYNTETNLEHNKESDKKIQNILSSTMKTSKIYAFPSSPDVSSIHSDSSILLKQQIMKDYFEKNKERLQEVLHLSNSLVTSSKPTDFVENETPRNPDSGKASSRYTAEHSGQSTERMTNDDIFITPRNDSLLTDFTVRDEWSSSHTNFQLLSELISSPENENFNASDKSKKILNNPSSFNFNAKTSIDLIDFSSQMDLQKIPTSYSTVGSSEEKSSQDVPGSNFELYQTTPTSQKLSTLSNIMSPYDRNLLNNNQYSEKSTTECESSPYKCLESFHSSDESVSNGLSREQIHEFETISQFENKYDVNCSVDSKSEADMSSLSLVSFLRNESVCQKFAVSDMEIKSESTPKKPVTKPNIENNEEMKIQLEKWKKERLQKINNNPPSENKKFRVTKNESMRRKDVVETKSRTIKLWNQLEEVKKMKQLKEAEKIKQENQLRKKEYAEKLRRLKMEKQKKV